ncbi:hypothetical protein [Bacillus sp. 1P06AnD]|uniref:hypothetical protein n=1 Tax=Bacillus sp. 1P06AnD TaxID=3132208 RepID=UPI0039A02019
MGFIVLLCIIAIAVSFFNKNGSGATERYNNEQQVHTNGLTNDGSHSFTAGKEHNHHHHGGHHNQGCGFESGGDMGGGCD